ncbi:aromatic ring-hydroxylating dioxygenase subunit alpha [Sphingorhabdus sp. IMCC26285]|uniref:Aromatic ring-hydroxylating dioxygenase subunit alpha n=1 Tax=Sphingorhabdus profundilacus TaxID=2509718 RepID=A0A6I4LSW8_9SPHN|nr:aromatic ring-hydroxylating dioxygenase subunit alpha [Sphingorhabdus profundilacus]MVZ96522.1 aromatic ring-hydroxylating dioxygenase subunit alpha [Sphingorhabdus profundilacus]
MARFESIQALLQQDRKGHTLPRELYVGEDAFQFDTQVMLKSVWLYACTAAHVKNPGDFFVFEVGHNAIIIVRGRDNEIRAFWNSCRHRGSKICVEQRGRVPRLMCPYHQWTYGLDGKLLAARSMAEDFDKQDHGLNPVALENVGGLIFICMDDNPPSIERVKADIEDQIAIYDIERLKVVVQDNYIEDANWKLVMENNRECYHCDAGHPELISVLGTYGFGKGLPEDGEADVVDDAAFDAMVEAKRAHWQDLGIFRELIEFPDGWWHRMARLPLANGAVTQSIDGKLACKKLIGPFTEPESSSLSVWTQPNSWHHFCCDHVVTFSLTPVAAGKTLLRTSWLVHEDAVEGVDYDPDHLAALWRTTNTQDGHFSMLNHQGISSDGYQQGPYAVEEKLVEDFKDFYVSRSKAALEQVKA